MDETPEYSYGITYWRTSVHEDLQSYGTCRTDEHPHTRCSRIDWISVLDMWKRIFSED